MTLVRHSPARCTRLHLRSQATTLGRMSRLVPPSGAHSSSTTSGRMGKPWRRSGAVVPTAADDQGMDRGEHEASEGNWVCTADGTHKPIRPWSSIGDEPNGAGVCVNMWGNKRASGRNDGAWNDHGCTDAARMPCICRGGGGGSVTTFTGHGDSAPNDERRRLPLAPGSDPDECSLTCGLRGCKMTRWARSGARLGRLAARVGDRAVPDWWFRRRV